MVRPAQIVSSVLSAFRRWIAPPASADEDKTRLAALLDTLVLIAVGLWWVLLILLAAFRVGNRTNMLIGCGASVLLLGVRELMRRRRLTLALALGISLGWGVVTGYLYNLGTPYAVHLVGYLVVLIIAMWLGGLRAGAAVGLLSIVSVFALARAEAAGLLPPAVRMPPLHLALNLAGYLGAVSALLFLVRTNLMRAFGQAQAEIAERAAAQAALQRSEASLKAAERIAHTGSWERDLVTGDLTISEGLYRLLGFDPATPARSVYAAAWDAVHPDDVAATRAAIARAQAAAAPLDITFRLSRPAGELITLRMQAEFVRDAAGQPVLMAATAQDITERQRVVDELDRRIQELSSLQDLGHIVSLESSLEEIIQTYLARLVNLASVDLAQVFLLREGRLHLAGVCTDLAGSVAQVCRLNVGECLCGRAVQERQPVYAADVECDARVTLKHCHANGVHSLAALPLRCGEAIIGVLAVAAVAPDALAGRLAFLETVADLVAVRLHNALLHQELREHAAGLEETVGQRTRELQAERDRTRAVLETVGESVVVTDLDGQLLFVNPATTTLTGHDRDEELGRPLWRDWTEQARTEIWPEAQAALRAGRAWHGEISGQQRNGATYVAVLTATPLYDADVTQGPVGAVWAQRDITLAKETARLKDQFVANVSHELRTPISIVALGCDNLEAFHDRLDAGQRLAIVRDIRVQANRLSAIVADTLQISQIDAGRVPMERQRLDLARLVREEADGLQPLIERRAQRLSVAAAAAVTVLGNETQLRQVVRNLLDNAIKYTLAGRQISCTCKVHAGAPGGGEAAGAAGCGEAWAVVEVTDDGIGIAARDLPYLFERFYRVNGEGATPGTGLGLPIAQELVALHGGWIGVASTHGQGSTFTIYLPLAGQEA